MALLTEERPMTPWLTDFRPLYRFRASTGVPNDRYQFQRGFQD